MTKKQPIKRIVEVKETDTGDSFVELPEEVLEELGWNEYTTIHMELEDGNVKIKQKTFWELEEFKEHLEMIFDDVYVNKTKHTLRHNGRIIAIG